MRTHQSSARTGSPVVRHWAIGHSSIGNGDPSRRLKKIRANTHPTVKSVALMSWLMTLVTPPGGLVLDPFAGSGTTGVAALASGRNFLLIEREAAYVEITKRRLEQESAQGKLL